MKSLFKKRGFQIKRGIRKSNKMMDSAENGTSALSLALLKRQVPPLNFYHFTNHFFFVLSLSQFTRHTIFHRQRFIYICSCYNTRDPTSLSQFIFDTGTSHPSYSLFHLKDIMCSY